MLPNEKPVVLHHGVFKPTATVTEAVFMITGMTIGAGVLGIPYVIAQVGLIPGLMYIFGLGIVMLFLNLMIGEIAVRTKENFQLPGYAGKYLGPWAKTLLSFTTIFISVGALLAYVVGEGRTLSALFGGDPAMWSAVFWTLGSLVVWRGLQTAKKVDKVFSFLVIAIIIGLSFYLLPHFQPTTWSFFNPAQVFLPYGVILFAIHASSSISEAHALLPGSQRHFRKALVIGTLIPVVLYMFFAVAVVGAMGGSTTEVATIGLGQKFGPAILVLANLFAIFAMGTGFVGVGVAFKQTLTWDYKINNFLSTLLVIIAPISLFMVGIRSFVGILDVAGGLFIGVEAVLMVMIYWRAKKTGDLDASRYKLDWAWLMMIPVLLVFTAATVLSVIKLIGY
jgi:amino acid permease